MSNNLYLEAESDNYHIIFCDPGYEDGDDAFSDRAFIHLKSKKTRSLVPYIKVKDVIGSKPSYIKRFFDEAKRLEGHSSLDEHLSRFLPLSHVAEGAFPGYDHYAYGSSVINQTGCPLSAMDVINKYFDEKSPVYDWIKMKGWLEDKDVTGTEQVTAKNNLLRLLSDKIRDHGVLHDSVFTQRSSFDSVYHSLSKYLSKLFVYDHTLSGGEFREAVSGVFFSNRQKGITQKIWPKITAPYLADDLSSDHPAKEGLYRMAFGDNPYLTREDILSSGLLDGSSGYGNSPSNLPINIGMPGIHEAHAYSTLLKRGLASQMLSFMTGKDDVEQRNIFQTFRSFQFDPGVMQSRIFSHREIHDYRHDISKGINPSKLLHKITVDYLESGTFPSYSLKKDKFGKRDFNVISHNNASLNKIINGGKPAEIITLEGEALLIEPYSRIDIMEKYMQWGGDGRMRDSSKIAKVTLKNSEGNSVFDGVMDCDKLSQGMGLVIADMPKGLLTKPSHLLALETLADSPVFKKKLSSGFMMLRDGALHKASDYRGVWDSLIAGIDRVLDGHEPYGESTKKLRQSKVIEKYTSSMHVHDGERIMNAMGTALGVYYLKSEGVPVQSKFNNFDQMNDEMEENDREFILDDRVFDADPGAGQHRLGSPFSLKFPGVNHAIAASDRLHKGYSAVIAEAGPNIEASWPASLPEISIDLPSGKTATLKPITSYMDVRREGREQDHCLGSYGARCLRREYEAFQVFVDGEHAATLGMGCNGDTLHFDQLQGYRNSAVSPELDDAIREFAEAIEDEGEYKGHEVTIEPADNDDLKLSSDDLISLQLDVDITNPESIEKCREFLIERIGEDATKELVLSSIDAANDHYQKRFLSEFNEWQDHYEECGDVPPPEVPHELEQIDRAKRSVERDFGSRAEMAMG